MNDQIQFLRESIRVLVRHLGLLEKSKAACCQLTLGQCHALVEIGRAQEISLNELATLLQLDKSTTSRTVNNLVKLNYVEREINEEDRRFMRIRLTPSGQQLFLDIEENMGTYYEKVLSKIAVEKQEQVIESLGLLIEALKEINYSCKEC